LDCSKFVNFVVAWRYLQPVDIPETFGLLFKVANIVFGIQCSASDDRAFAHFQGSW
jgi:hypothetical protein